MNQPTHLKILSCNIRVIVAEDGQSGNGWSDRKDLCAEVILAQNADLICLQECTIGQFEDMRHGLRGFDSYGLRNLALAMSPSNAIFYCPSRFELVSSGGFWLSETPHIAGSISWDSARSRFANWVDLKERGSGRQFRVWSLHLDHIGQIARENQARVLVEAAQVFDDLPQLLTGDFNADASNPAIDIVKAGGWLDTHTALHGPDDPGFTFHGFLGPGYAETKPPEKLIGKIDFIFCRGPVKPLSADIIRDNRNGQYPSDHYFLSAEVEL